MSRPPSTSVEPATADSREGRRSRILGQGDDGTRSAIITVISAVVVFGLIGTVIVRSPGWPAIHHAFFDGTEFAASFPYVVRHFGADVFMFVVAELLVLPLALMIAVLRSLRGPAFAPLRWMAIAYVDIFRGIPTILVIVVLGFGMPGLGLAGVPSSKIFWGIVSLTLVYSAYVAEVYRAGIESIHPSQVAAARSLGLSRMRTMRFVVLPQAIRNVIPPLLNDFIGMQKDAALVSVIGASEALRAAQIESAATFNFTPYLAVALLFLLITIPMTRLVDWLIARERKKRGA